MKITAVKPFAVGYGRRNVFLVKIETSAGIHGWGEGGLSGRELPMSAAVEALKPVLIGEDPRRIDHLWQVMFRGGFFEAGDVTSAAISAIDLALWDILGKHLKVPCWQLLGGRSRDHIECYTHVTLDTIKERVAQGWRNLRLGADASPERPTEFDPDDAVRRTIQTMKRARELAGDDVKLCIDFHTRFNPPAAAQACNGIAEMRPLFVEDPLRWKGARNYIAFRKRTSVPLAVGEACSSKWEFQQLIEEDAIDYARIDICNVGGLTEARKVAEMSEVHYIDVVPHNPLGPVSTAACIHLAAAIPNFLVLENCINPNQSPGLFTNSFKFEAPRFKIPEAPGLGIDIVESELPAHPMKPWLPPGLQRPDGGFTNW
jgi:galactonate dehydratase